jgi:hypothetical protein
MRRDDPFWQTNYPPNGWGCRCRVRPYSEAALKKRGLKVIKNPKSIADKDWAYDVGAGNKVAKLSKLTLDDSLRTLKPNKALDKLDESQLKDRFFKTLGIKSGQMLIDKTGDPMWVGDELFTATTTSKSKLTKKKDKRRLYMDELAKTINDPDEIYLEIEMLKTGKARTLKKMFKYFKDETGKQKGLVSIFEYQKDKTIGVSSYVVNNKYQLDRKRIEKLVYKKVSKVIK